MTATVSTLSMPAFVPPCLAQQQEAPPEGDRWLHELKLDGFRVQVLKDGRTVRLLSRHGHNLASRFPELALAMLALPFRRVLLDGELVAHGPDGMPP